MREGVPEGPHGVQGREAAQAEPRPGNRGSETVGTSARLELLVPGGWAGLGTGAGSDCHRARSGLKVLAGSEGSRSTWEVTPSWDGGEGTLVSTG